MFDKSTDADAENGTASTEISITAARRNDSIDRFKGKSPFRKSIAFYFNIKGELCQQKEKRVAPFFRCDPFLPYFLFKTCLKLFGTVGLDKRVDHIVHFAV